MANDLSWTDHVGRLRAIADGFRNGDISTHPKDRERQAEWLEQTADAISTGPSNAVLEWRKDCWGNERQALYLGGICIGCVIHKGHKLGNKWRAWLMTDDEGSEVAECHTADDARRAVMDAARSALSPANGGPFNTLSTAGK